MSIYLLQQLTQWQIQALFTQHIPQKAYKQKEKLILGKHPQDILQFQLHVWLYLAVNIVLILQVQLFLITTSQALQQYIEQNYKQTNGQKMGEATFNLLYSLYALPNIIVPLIGGMLIDTRGPRFTLVLTATICVIGHFVFGIAGYKNIFSLMLIGRLIFGIGGEVLHAAQNTLISQWFKASQLSMVLGICISAPKLGSSLNAVLSPSIAQKFQGEKQNDEWENVGIPLFVGLGMMIFSLIMAIILFIIDKKSEQSETINHQSKVLSKKQKPMKKKLSQISSMPKSIVMDTSSEIRAQFNQNSQQQHGHFNFKAIAKLPITYWLLLFVAMLTEALFIPFLDNGNKYFTTIYKSIKKPQDAGLYLILPYVVSTVAVIPMGFFADKIKNRGFTIIGSCGFISLTYLIMLYIETDGQMRKSSIIPWIPVFLLGICIAIFCTIIVPTVPMIVPPSLMGSGFGMMEMLQNLALCTFPLLAGAIRQTQQTQLQGFHIQSLFFFLMSCLCLSFAILLEAFDRLRGNKLKQEQFRSTYISKYQKE